LNKAYLEQARAVSSDNWLLINAASRRANELACGARPVVRLTPGEAVDFLDIALREIAEGKLSVNQPASQPEL